MTERIPDLPVDREGYPLPFFIAWPDAELPTYERMLAAIEKHKVRLLDQVMAQPTPKLQAKAQNRFNQRWEKLMALIAHLPREKDDG